MSKIEKKCRNCTNFLPRGYDGPTSYGTRRCSAATDERKEILAYREMLISSSLPILHPARDPEKERERLEKYGPPQWSTPVKINYEVEGSTDCEVSEEFRSKW